MKTISILVMLMAIGCNLPSAQASLLGMPMHLKGTAEREELNKWLVPSNPSGDVFTGETSTSVQIINC